MNQKIRCPAKDGKGRSCGRHVATIVNRKDGSEVVEGPGGYVEPNLEEWWIGERTGETSRRTHSDAYCSKHGFVVSLYP